MHTLAIFILSPLFTLLSISKISKPFSLLKICHQIVHKVLEAFNWHWKRKSIFFFFFLRKKGKASSLTIKWKMIIISKTTNNCFFFLNGKTTNCSYTVFFVNSLFQTLSLISHFITLHCMNHGLVPKTSSFIRTNISIPCRLIR